MIGILEKELFKYKNERFLNLQTDVTMSRQAGVVKGQVNDQSEENIEAIKM